ncbi:hypothetical protein BDP27DRAFT_1449102 [Rhodocollybia butyracea]|uniref:Protein kinase domain-containing protein n=1 Tax=Rhodocollybia butyracea TaxID=206335 RepID=A0A9P5U710_9AGAR|nr:hypothetical protein BDP27DRAFT_1449102 [Rhodocollybia butyracea]
MAPDMPHHGSRYTPASWDNEKKEADKPGYILKLFLWAPEDSKLRREIEALRLVGQLVKAGQVVVENQKKNAIVMHEAPGKTMKQLREDHPKEIVKIMKRWIPAIAAKAAHFAKQGLSHHDLNEGNIFISMNKNTAEDFLPSTGVTPADMMSRVTLIDWGYYDRPGEKGFTDDSKEFERRMGADWGLMEWSQRNGPTEAWLGISKKL